MTASGFGDLRTREPLNIYYPEDTAEYTILNFSLKFDLLSISERGWAPWISLGYALHMLNWNTYAYTMAGSGFAPGFGLDVAITPSLFLRGRAAFYSVDMTDNYDGAGVGLKSNEVNFMLVYEFGKKKKSDM
ncbi:hypothetical protein EP232_01825 [bacterium]|nr:MAG: hypothetical protein EP232_01825 [bacterium]